jgi:diguanylate cyclase (GGDEF)-like protein
VRLSYLSLQRLSLWSSTLIGRVYALVGLMLVAVLALTVVALRLARLTSNAAHDLARDQTLTGEHMGELETLLAHSDRLQWWIIGLALIALLLVGPVSILVVRRATHRMRSIARSMFRLARNDLTPTAATDTGADEIGAMARAVAAVSDNERSLIESRQQLEELNICLDVALNNMRRGLSMFDADQRLVLCNDVYRRMYDLPADLTRPGTLLVDLIRYRHRASTDDEETFKARALGYRSFIATMTPRNHTLTMSDGRIIDVSLQPLVSGGWVAVHQDITRQRQDEQKIHRLARQDTLTSLDNRRGLQEALEQRCRDRETADVAAFAVHAIDLDRFKDVNDTYGHATGDGLLEAVALRLRGAARQNDLVARLGGDEFAVVQSGLLEPIHATKLAERLVKVLAEPFQIRGQSLTIGASVGVALAPDHGSNPNVLLQHADMALYCAKTKGRGTYHIFDSSLAERHIARKAFERDLSDALGREQLRMYYQPIISLTDFSVLGCEALMRWQHPVRGFVSPADFIPVAEDIGLIHDLGRFALETAVQDATLWPDAMMVSVNLSPAQVSAPELVPMIAGLLSQRQFLGHRLELEVTETVLLGEDSTTLASLHRIHELGISIALDDFGTGYSSLRYLRSFPFDKLKIDRSFVHDLTSDKSSAAIVGAVAGLAHSLQMVTVAEGVETEEHLALVKAAGCTAAQGYLISRPVPVAELPAVLAACARRALIQATSTRPDSPEIPIRPLVRATR